MHTLHSLYMHPTSNCAPSQGRVGGWAWGAARCTLPICPRGWAFPPRLGQPPSYVHRPTRPSVPPPFAREQQLSRLQGRGCRHTGTRTQCSRPQQPSPCSPGLEGGGSLSLPHAHTTQMTHRHTGSDGAGRAAAAGPCRGPTASFEGSHTRPSAKAAADGQMDVPDKRFRWTG